MEIARMFGGWPHDLFDISISEFARLKKYYLFVRKSESSRDEPDDDLKAE